MKAPVSPPLSVRRAPNRYRQARYSLRRRSFAGSASITVRQLNWAGVAPMRDVDQREHAIASCCAQSRGAYVCIGSDPRPIGCGRSVRRACRGRDRRDWRRLRDRATCSIPNHYQPYRQSARQRALHNQPSGVWRRDGGRVCVADLEQPPGREAGENPIRAHRQGLDHGCGEAF